MTSSFLSTTKNGSLNVAMMLLAYSKSTSIPESPHFFLSFIFLPLLKNKSPRPRARRHKTLGLRRQEFPFFAARESAGVRGPAQLHPHHEMMIIAVAGRCQE